MRPSCLVRSLAAAGFACASTMALAQVPPQLPPSVDPGRIEERLPPQKPPPRRIDLPDSRQPVPDVPDALKGVKVTLKEVRIEGTSLLLDEAWSLAGGYVGRQITGAEIFGLARSMTALYRNAGYILSVVVVPPQELSAGRLTLRVVEGYIANVRVEGDPAVAGTLAALGEKIKASRPLTADTLERYLLIANSLPGVRVRAVLAPSQAVGAADLTLIATVKRADGYVSLDNYGSKYLGPGQLTVDVSGSQLIGVNDHLRFAGITTGNGELAYGQVSYGQVVGSEGLRLGVSGSKTRTKPGDVLEPFQIRGHADTLALAAAYPLSLTRNSSFLGRAVLDARNINTDILGTRVIEDRIRALRMGLTWLAFDRLDGQNTLDVELSKGLGGTQQSDPLKSRAGADGKFGKVIVDFERFQRLGTSFGVTLGAAAQWSDEPLLSSEQYALGGRRFGRAYEPAEVVGDRALAFRAEPAYLGRGDGWGYQLYGYYDVGKVWYRDDPALGPSRPGVSLASAGFGTRLFAAERITAGLELAQPLTKPVASYQASGHGNRARILGSVTVRF